VQVKSTARGYEKIDGDRYLNVRVSKKDLDRLAAFPAPTYVVGIDEKTWKAYLLSANESRVGISRFPTRFPLNRKNMQKLWEEVEAFWSCRDMVLRNSYFRE
jgi:hypothetical protein